MTMPHVYVCACIQLRQSTHTICEMLHLYYVAHTVGCVCARVWLCV
jgi:hypothetical protein